MHYLACFNSTQRRFAEDSRVRTTDETALQKRRKVSVGRMIEHREIRYSEKRKEFSDKIALVLSKYLLEAKCLKSLCTVPYALLFGE